MKKIKEADIREALKQRVTAYGGSIRAVSWLGRRSAPDVLCLFPKGSLFEEKMTELFWLSKFEDENALHPFIETKRPKKSATAAQAREHETMREAGCVVLVITTLQELDAWLPPL